GYDRSFNRETQAENATRAGLIIDKILRGVASSSRSTLPKAIGTVLYFVWGLVQLSIPQSVGWMVKEHLGKITVFVTALLAIVAFSLGLTAAIVLVAIFPKRKTTSTRLQAVSPPATSPAAPAGSG